MSRNLKMSKYNFICLDKEGDLILYNFLNGISSLTKIKKSDIDSFTNGFLTNSEKLYAACNEYKEMANTLLKLGILVDDDTDESVLYDAKQYSEIYDTKLYLTIFPTGKCNFRCPYCFETSQDFSRDTMTSDSQDAILKFVQKTISNHRMLHVSWFGGEPLVASEVVENLSDKFIQICNVRHIPYSADMVTNGFLLDSNMFDTLYKLQVYDYMITIDGFKKQHDKRRFTYDGKGSYDTIMDNLLKIRNNKQYKFANIMIRVNMSTGFLEMLDEFVNFLGSSFADDPRFKFMFVPVVKFSSSHFSNEIIYSNHKELYMRLSKNDVYTNKLYPNMLKLTSILPQQKCPACLKNSYVITSDLSVYKCNAHYDFDINKIGRVNLNGDLLIDETLHRRWYLMKKSIQRIPESCNDCFYSPCCLNIDSGCPVSYLKTNPDVTLCPLKDENKKNNIVETILYAADIYPCTTLAL